MNTQPNRFGLIGYPLEHSASAEYFAEKFKREGLTHSYSLFPLLSADEVLPLLHAVPGLQGFNVTIPFKQSIIPLLDQLDPIAEEIAAVNTVVVKRSDSGFQLSGYNTDADGFGKSLKPGFRHTHALILGTGGSSKAVTYCLKRKGLNVLHVSRNKRDNSTIGYEDIGSDLLNRFTFIVNCTPLGMFPLTDAAPDLPYELLKPFHEAYDLIYNPIETRFLRYAREAGAVTQNGRNMFENQADLSFEIWMTSDI
ncbi:MAG: shikimate dehydrogenase [Bacteroidetes bacterium]|nr:shikimate dehydrogenase [Bacteroidota bacterium]